MVVMKMTHFEHTPDTCDDCIYYSCKPHPYKGWSDGCELCGHCMDDDQEEGWIYDGNSRPKNCPLMEVNADDEQEPKTGWIPVSERLPEKDMPCLVWVGIFHITKIAVYSDLLKTIEHKIFYTYDYGHADFVDITEYVLAWMPLPKPYEPQESDHKCHTCNHYTSGEHDGSCGSYICKGYSNWESEENG